MPKILPITSFGNNQATISSDTKSLNKNEYPVSYEQYKKRQDITNVVLSIFTGGISACIMRLLKFEKKSSYIGGVIVTAGFLAMGISSQRNNVLKAQYLMKKRKFENS